MSQRPLYRLPEAERVLAAKALVGRFVRVQVRPRASEPFELVGGLVAVASAALPGTTSVVAVLNLPGGKSTWVQLAAVESITPA